MVRDRKLDLELELELDNRKSVYEFIRMNPGTHMREIQRRLTMPIGLLRFHIEYLIKHELITVKTDRYYKRYYLRGDLGSVDKVALSALRQQNPRWIILYLLENTNAKHKDMLLQFELKPSTLSFYLNNLTKKRIVIRKRIGRESIYVLSDPESIVQLLITYQPSFLDKLVDRFLETWFDSFPEDDLDVDEDLDDDGEIDEK